MSIALIDLTITADCIASHRLSQFGWFLPITSLTQLLTQIHFNPTESEIQTDKQGECLGLLEEKKRDCQTNMTNMMSHFEVKIFIKFQKFFIRINRTVCNDYRFHSNKVTDSFRCRWSQAIALFLNQKLMNFVWAFAEFHLNAFPNPKHFKWGFLLIRKLILIWAFYKIEQHCSYSELPNQLRCSCFRSASKSKAVRRKTVCRQPKLWFLVWKKKIAGELQKKKYTKNLKSFLVCKTFQTTNSVALSPNFGVRNPSTVFLIDRLDRRIRWWQTQFLCAFLLEKKGLFHRRYCKPSRSEIIQFVHIDWQAQCIGLDIWPFRIVKILVIRL